MACFRLSYINGSHVVSLQSLHLYSIFRGEYILFFLSSFYHLKKFFLIPYYLDGLKHHIGYQRLKIIYVQLRFLHQLVD